MDSEYDKLIRRLNPPRYSSSFFVLIGNGFDFLPEICFWVFVSHGVRNSELMFLLPRFLVLVEILMFQCWLTSGSDINNLRQ